ncbi:unnamed protein product [Arabidopsis thaliana]|uniref:Uncharacterized protein n=1 Tax=Arabidopsis thaliana TaxID=3702 RepID=A0A5S9XWK9_ARATH|nr:unnamed protein product [Arabidopsis thaliana]
MFQRVIGRPLLAKVKQTTGIVEVCPEEEDWGVIEKRLSCGKVEEFIEEASDELTLVGKMIGSLHPNLILAPIPKHVPHHRPGPLPEEFYRTLQAVNSESKTEITATSSSDPQLKE